MGAPQPSRDALPALPARPRVAVVIPTLNEAEPIAAVIAAIPRAAVDEIIIVDSGSSDQTVERARAAGARVLIEAQAYNAVC